ncbi:MAG TPA: SRPBCC family protein [Bryobacteraceae bacterium]|nr:SRPBCC family protein [Bryobacteraceae bacterium]
MTRRCATINRVTNAPQSDYTLERETTVAAPLDKVFAFFSQPENLEALTPPWLQFRIETPQPIEIREGTLIAYRLRMRGIRIRWLTEIQTWRPPFEFVDIQLKGPYKLWHHTHRFEKSGSGTRIIDVVRYSLPFGPLGRLVHRLQVAKDIAKIFDYRETRVQALFS